ncbi:PREDICTED: pentatricopeptide repeat-containing protein At1g06710, mitochondrial-like [Nicotiana attenuata]|uniref:pentatricopeptide repeat-containing protein At1g06710, mitochondrial-like n=1 Tax=Nicotiana attenuata TaxID=49451 RepID=UPI000904A595|nr:PREDICTED: pentatricopeptide repeat-containing protein At1g06710, mitochondrial-like [Nicotiana attenuata]
MTIRLFRYALPRSVPSRFVGHPFKFSSRFICSENNLVTLVDPELRFPENESFQQEKKMVISKDEISKFSDDAFLVINAIRKGNDGFGERTERVVRHFREKLNPGLVVDVLRNIQNPELGVKFFMWAGRQIGYVHNASVYDALLDVIGCDVPLHFVQDIGKDDREVLGKLLNVLISKCCRNGLWDLVAGVSASK